MNSKRNKVLSTYRHLYLLTVKHKRPEILSGRLSYCEQLIFTHSLNLRETIQVLQCVLQREAHRCCVRELQYISV